MNAMAPVMPALYVSWEVQQTRRLFFVCLFVCFACAGSSSLFGLFSMKRGGPALELWSVGSRAHGLRNCDSSSLEHRLNSCGSWA